MILVNDCKNSRSRDQGRQWYQNKMIIYHKLHVIRCYSTSCAKYNNVISNLSYHIIFLYWLQHNDIALQIIPIGQILGRVQQNGIELYLPWTIFTSHFRLGGATIQQTMIRLVHISSRRWQKSCVTKPMKETKLKKFWKRLNSLFCKEFLFFPGRSQFNSLNDHIIKLIISYSITEKLRIRRRYQKKQWDTICGVMLHRNNQVARGWIGIEL